MKKIVKYPLVAVIFILASPLYIILSAIRPLLYNIILKQETRGGIAGD